MSERFRAALSWILKAVAIVILVFTGYVLFEISTAPPSHPIFTAAAVTLSTILLILGILSLLT
ncbi:MAG: hypothetical protein J7J94_00555 [Thaumarchaeota archaeon]|nr:hypothetical protein [Nitrososphaerota archaeon]